MQNSQKYDVVIAGAGASGLVAAIRAAESGASVLVVEKMHKPGRKIRITGKGRCNITNSEELEDFIKKVYPNGKFLYSAFHEFYTWDIIALLEACGVSCKIERGGRYYPESDKGADVANALFKKAKSLGVIFMFETALKKISITNGRLSSVLVSSDAGEQELSCSKCILCTGGKSYPATGSTGDGYRLAEQAGHEIINPLPALVALQTDSPHLPLLVGLKLKNVMAVLQVDGKPVGEEFGELYFTDRGLDGPVVLSLSRFAATALNKGMNCEISLDMKPALDDDKLDHRLQRDMNENGKKNLKNLFKSWLPSQMIPVFFDILDINPDKPAHQVSGSERHAIRKLMKDFRFKLTGTGPWEEAVITAGGINTDEVNPKTLESKKLKGLYFAGEILNLDAETGGYNLQIAWSTGWLAGKYRK
ncbi:MAG: NAD(P)/FAD-dependent oxidoreductase [Bacteroidota bacterium]|nr:NAD(P)/FAD-dependent oxidoreductase [Bacteroidota bacterium]